MAECKITLGFSATDCNGLEQGGTSGDLYLINYNDYLTATITEDPDGTITDITLTTIGAQAFKFELTRGAPVLTSPLTVNNAGKSGYLHNVAAFIPTKDQATKTDFSNLINFGRVIAIVVLDSTVVSNLFGNDMGLSMTAYEEAPNDPSVGGGLQITLSTPADTTLENLPGRTVFSVDRATTIQILEDLLTPVV